ncbi:MAG TPA: 30S ribosomal protein S17 [Syntrophaceae bacterium]|nr:30S ribosomal protein S17 [Syntrophaceae bacterium]
MIRERGVKKTQLGIVVSNKMDKTVVVEVTTMVRHRSYKKYVRRKTRYKAHDARNECNIGDKVLIAETRPLSRDKRWKVERILERGSIE